jgi:hypothetical protein
MGKGLHRMRGAAPLATLAIAAAAAVCLAAASGLRAGETRPLPPSGGGPQGAASQGNLSHGARPEGSLPDLHAAEAAPVDTSDLGPEERERIERLFTRVMCACPEEDWTRTLAGCPHGCSDRQKEMVRQGVKKGLPDEEILADQVRTFGTEKVLAIPRSAAATLVPYLFLVVFTAGAIFILAASLRPSRPGGTRERTVEAPGGATEEDRRIGEAVERDLEAMDR